ncbi:hypothetical protein CFIMG_003022RA [Ceratocystis fimbriata CBS 114723]|uniref:C2H2-type domain-containing protein n=1 Tax=Ceratocystis fimbriata CBS 114723 TaxID=1035309 RepID=A0A2C5XBF0_9PEZI|nr:hypothetical protein CFIMG_003022RA [Ceratocystis fimbriata CBS 114723]
MPVAYEPRQFIHETSYSSIADNDPSASLPDPYSNDAVPDLSFNVSVPGPSPPLLPVEDHERNIIEEEAAMAIAVSVAEHAHLDLSTAPIPNLSIAALAGMPALAEHTELHLSDLKSPEAESRSPHIEEPETMNNRVDMQAEPETEHEPGPGPETELEPEHEPGQEPESVGDAGVSSSNADAEINEDDALDVDMFPQQQILTSSTYPSRPPLSPGKAMLRMWLITKPEREVEKQSDGKYHCTYEYCSDAQQAFNRKCEWNKHMDKHERPYRCDQPGCDKLPGFTYSGGLLRHQREVHGKHGGPKKTVNCPHLSCKRHTGKGFSRQENLNEHLRRVHTSDTSGIASPPDEAQSLSDESEKGGLGDLPAVRKRPAPGSSTGVGASTGEIDAENAGGDGTSSDEVLELREQVKRLQQENQDLRTQFQQEQLSMMAQITELQGALRLNNASSNSPPPVL